MSEHQRVFVIAEAGVNHNGDLDIALKLAEAAAGAGADAVKFQTFRADALVRRGAPKAPYQTSRANSRESQFEMLQRLELSQDAHRQLACRCRDLGIGFSSTPFDLESVLFLRELGVDFWKIPSGEITNLPYLRLIAQQTGRIVLSTGMSTIAEVADAVRVLTGEGVDAERLGILHCTTSYPAPLEDVNLRAMLAMRDRFPGVCIGYSDHTRGEIVPIAAAAMGGGIVEKHLTLDRGMDGPDHHASLDPVEFSHMVGSIRDVEVALGTEEKRPTPSERENVGLIRRSIVAKHAIACGSVIREDDLDCKRPGSGMSPMLWDEVIGSQACRAFGVDEDISL